MLGGMPSGQPVDISVVAVNYRTPEMTARAVRMATASAGPYATEQLVVDNAATPAGTAALRTLLPGAEVIPSDENRGFGAGVNAALSRAHGTAVFIVNSDAFCRPGALARLADALEAYPRAGLLAPRLLSEDGRPQGSAYRRFPGLVTLFF